MNIIEKIAAIFQKPVQPPPMKEPINTLGYPVVMRPPIVPIQTVADANRHFQKRHGAEHIPNGFYQL